MERFLALPGVTSETRIVDVGAGDSGLKGLAPFLNVTGVDLIERPGFPGPFVRADATQRLPFDDGEFDLAYSNSVIEHVPRHARERFAAELR
ncbi:MAG: class I SAM-dependent methyltransferase, partial [Solirubrobacteraceae bacterium]